jgi:hypothetical protein
MFKPWLILIGRTAGEMRTFFLISLSCNIAFLDIPTAHVPSPGDSNNCFIYNVICLIRVMIKWIRTQFTQKSLR